MLCQTWLMAAASLEPLSPHLLRQRITVLGSTGAADFALVGLFSPEVNVVI